MSRIIISLLIVLAFAIAILPAADSLVTYPVGPGVNYSYIVKEAYPWRLYVLEIDLTNPYIGFESVKANELLVSREATSSMTARNSYPGHRAIGAVNGDFYVVPDGIPISLQISRGVPVNNATSAQPAILISNDNDVTIEFISQSLKLITGAGTVAINKVNSDRLSDELVMYNKFYGATTNTNIYGSEYSLAWIDEPLCNDTVRCLVTGKWQNSGNHTIPGDGFILSAHGSLQGFMDANVNVGDTIQYYLKYNPSVGKIRDAIGGHPRIIRNGAISIEPVSGFTYDRHPRTAFGINADTTKAFFVVVDGRQSGWSVGMDLIELANFMLGLGVYQAENLDGGGSSTFVVDNKVMNSPSDGSERWVANSLMVFSRAPQTGLGHLFFDEEELSIYKGYGWQFTLRAYDEYMHIIDPDTVALEWTVTNGIGSIDANGYFTAGSQPGAGFVICSSGAIADSVPVTVEGLGKLALEPSPLVLEPGESQQMYANGFDTGGNYVQVNLADITWQYHGNGGAIDMNGLFSAAAMGNGFLLANSDGVTDSIPVMITDSAEVVIDDFAGYWNWDVELQDVEPAGTGWYPDSSEYVSAPASGRLDYRFRYTGGTNMVKLRKPLHLSGSPEYLRIAVYGDGHGDFLRAVLKDRDGELFNLNLAYIDWSDEWRVSEYPVAYAIAAPDNPGARLQFPVQLLGFDVFLLGGSMTALDGTIRLDDLQLKYGVINSLGEPAIQVPEDFYVGPGYPNPFNGTVHFDLKLKENQPARIEVYNILGARIRTLFSGNWQSSRRVMEWNGRDDAGNEVGSGEYFARISQGEKEARLKLMLLK
jgi:hypothetical protein